MVIESESVSASEKLVATIGGVIGITLIAYISHFFVGASGAAFIVPSIGASAVLVFALPHGKLSQPWALIGGNVISAAVGVTCYKLVPDPYIASGLAVGLSIGAMHVLGCIHPPGGATALIAVVGGSAITELGYLYVLIPILLNVIIIFVVAIIFNSLFPWRRYPACAMMRFTDFNDDVEKQGINMIDKKSIESALADMDLVMDVTLEDLQRVMQLSLLHASESSLNADQIKLHRYYTNGRHGPDWSVRRIIDESISADTRNDMVIYRVVEGQGFNTASSCSREEFARWAAREVFLN